MIFKIEYLDPICYDLYFRTERSSEQNEIKVNLIWTEAAIRRCSVKPQSLLVNKVADLWHRCFPVNFVKFLRTPISTEHLWWLLLYEVLLFSMKNKFYKENPVKIRFATEYECQIVNIKEHFYFKNQ